MSRMRILVTGAEGQLGRSLAKHAHTSQASVVFASRSDLDIADTEAFRPFFASHQFDFCINTAAYTKVDLAEQQQQEAHLINGIAPGFLAQACHDQGCTFIHLSSDYVYHNGLRRSLREDDPVSPVSVYAQTKLEGEQNALHANPRTLIIRTSWLFSEFGHNFVKTMTRLMIAGKSLRIVNDQFGCPTYAGDLALVILKIIKTLHADGPRDEMYGIFNYCNEGTTTWYDFAREIATMLGVTPDIIPVSTSDYAAPASRPLYSVLDTTKIKKAYGIQIGHWREGLSLVLEN